MVKCDFCDRPYYSWRTHKTMRFRVCRYHSDMIEFERLYAQAKAIPYLKSEAIEKMPLYQTLMQALENARKMAPSFACFVAEQILPILKALEGHLRDPIPNFEIPLSIEQLKELPCAPRSHETEEKIPTRKIRKGERVK